MSSHKKGNETAGTANKTKGSLVKVVVKEHDMGEWVRPNTLEKFYIDDEAAFPSIVFEIQTDVPGPYKWSWSMTWDAHVSGLRERHRGKKVGTFSARGAVTQDSQRWDAKTIGKVIGGKLTVIVDVGDKKFKRTVLVLATAPTAEKVKVYLRANNETALEKLLEQESQFKHVIARDSEPVVAGDSGYGIAQLTTPAPTFEQVWSWKENVLSAMKLISQKRKEAKHRLDGRGTYTQEMLDTETIALWNGGNYYEWKVTGNSGIWVRNTKILCDKKTGNIGWDTSVQANKNMTEDALHQRDKEEYKKMQSGQTIDHAWKYTGVCYADHILME